MRYWWVNQNATYKFEVPGNYLWSPKRSAGDRRNPYYDFMRVVSPGDMVFSFADTLIRAIGIVRAYAYEAPKPLEFGSAGAYWDNIGWRVDVQFKELVHQIRPAEHMQVIGKLLPGKYAPLQKSGKGLQNMYLTRVPADLADALVGLIGIEARNLSRSTMLSDWAQPSDAIGLLQWEAHQISELRKNADIPPTEKEALVMARRGQGRFRREVSKIEQRCRITHVDKEEHLRASHCKPWRDSSNEERLNGENGLLLTPTVDHLFDRGFISFEWNGDLLISPVAHLPSMARMGIDTTRKVNVGVFSSGQRDFLEFHRGKVFLSTPVTLD